MRFLDLEANNIAVSCLDLYLFVTVLFGFLMLMIFYIFSEESRLAEVYVGSFTILHILGLVLRQLILGSF